MIRNSRCAFILFDVEKMNTFIVFAGDVLLNCYHSCFRRDMNT